MDEAIRLHLGISSFSKTTVHGGDINEAFKIHSEKGNFFLKYNKISFAPSLFESEKAGLERLADVPSVTVPKPVAVLKSDQGAALLLEWINVGRTNANSWVEFAKMLAALHNTTQRNFGLDHDNFIGILKQVNKLNPDWLDFYASSRIEPQIKAGIDSGKLPLEAIELCNKCFSNISKEFPPVEASLLHGDLWSGNLIFNELSEPIFIDPAVYFGHREMDIAMMKLFGGFNEGFDYYQEIFPLQHGWEHRLAFYQLYYILVHVNLFGGSYTNSALSILKKYSD